MAKNAEVISKFYANTKQTLRNISQIRQFLAKCKHTDGGRSTDNFQPMQQHRKLFVQIYSQIKYDREVLKVPSFLPTCGAKYKLSVVCRLCNLSEHSMTRCPSGCGYQCDQIGQLTAFWATFQSLWQQLFCSKRSHLQTIFVKVSKSFIF